MMVIITVNGQNLKCFVVTQQFGALLALGLKHASVKAYFSNT